MAKFARGKTRSPLAFALEQAAAKDAEAKDTRPAHEEYRKPFGVAGAPAGFRRSLPPIMQAVPGSADVSGGAAAFSVKGTHAPASGVGVAAPTGFQVSLDNATWASSVVGASYPFGFWARRTPASLTADGSGSVALTATGGASVAVPLTYVEPTSLKTTAFWRFEEAAGPYADELGASALTGGGTGTLGRIAGVRAFAVQASVDATHSSTLTAPGVLGGGAAWSLSFWARRSTSAAVVTFGNLGGDANSQAQFRTGASTLRIQWGNDSAHWWEFPTAVNASTWTHVAVVFDGSGPTLAVYENGVAVVPSFNSAVLPGTWPSGATAAAVTVASTSGSRTADLDSAGFFNAALRAAEVAALYAAGVGLDYPF